MNDDFGGSYITMTDDEGGEFELELVDTLEYQGKSYTVFLPADIDEMDPGDPDYGYVILRNLEEEGEEFFASVDDEAELEAVYELYMKQLEEAEDADDSLD